MLIGLNFDCVQRAQLDKNCNCVRVYVKIATRTKTKGITALSTVWPSKMAHDNSVYLVYSVSDGVEWSNFMVSHLSQANLDVRCIELDSSGSLPTSFSKFRRGRVIVLLVSPGFLKSLLVNQSDSLYTLVNQKPGDDSVNPVVLFLCGTMMTDFEEKDADGRRLSERFTGLNSWKTVTHEELSQLPRTVLDLAGRTDAKKPQPKTRPKMKFKMVPEEVRCEVRNIHVCV